MRLAQQRDEWIARRVQRLTFCGEYAVERTTSCELTLEPAHFDALSAVYEGKLALPISNLLRSPARHVVAHVDGTEVPIMLRATERQIIASALAGRLASDPHVIDLSKGVRRLGNLPRAIEKLFLFHLDTPLALALPNKLMVLDEVLQTQFPPYAEGYIPYLNTRIVVPLADDSKKTLTVVESHAENIVVKRSTALGFFLARKNLQTSTESISSRWRYQEGDRLRPRRSVTVVDGSAMEVSRKWSEEADSVYRTKWRVPWWPDTYFVRVPVDDALDCKSFHAQVVVPPGVYIDRATLRLLNQGFRKNLSAKTGPAEMILVEDDDRHSDQAHLHFSPRTSYRNASKEMYRNSLLQIVLRPTYHNGLRAGFHISWLTTLAVLALTFTVGWQEGGRSCELFCGATFGRTEADALVGLLLLVPTVALVATVRQDEHDLAKKVQAHYRMRLYLLTVVLFFIGLAFAIHLEGWALFRLLVAGSAVSVCSTLWTAASAGYSKFRIWKRGYGSGYDWLERVIKRLRGHARS